MNGRWPKVMLVSIGVLTIFAVWIGAHGARVKKGRQ